MAPLNLGPQHLEMNVRRHPHFQNEDAELMRNLYGTYAELVRNVVFGKMDEYEDAEANNH